MARRIPNPPVFKDLSQASTFINEMVKIINQEFSDLYNRTNTEINLTSSSIVSVAADYKAGNRSFILVNASAAPITVKLPQAVNYYRDLFIVKKTNTNANQVTVQVSGGGTIDGMGSVNLSAGAPSLLVISDGSQYDSF